MARNPKVEFDLLKMYFGEPYEIDLESAVGKITVYSPTIGDIIRIGEKRFYQTLNIFVCNTTQYRTLLWDMGIDWNTLPDFHLFIMLAQQIDPEVSKLIFGDLDFSKFVPFTKKKPAPQVEDESMQSDDSNKDDSKSESTSVDNTDDKQDEGEIILWDDDDQIEINADVHNHFSQYLRVMFNTFPEEKITQNASLKNWYITKDRRAMENEKKLEAKGKGKSSTSMQPIISACVNHPGFKYKLKELKDVGVFEFYDSVSRLQIYEQSTALLKGMYSGFIDGKGIKPEDYNFMREIIRDANNSVSKASALKENG